MQAALERFEQVWSQATAIWSAGGWCMPAIAFTALLMSGLGVHLHLKLREKGFLSVSEKEWRRWLDAPAGRRGAIGRLIDYAAGGRTLDQLGTAFKEVRATEVAPFERDLRVLRVCVSAAPLLGLLGTVTGMLATFDALASGSGADQTMALVAQGISEALITTETGLVVALPGVFLQYQIARKLERYKAFLAHVETVSAQNLYRKLRGAPAAPAVA